MSSLLLGSVVGSHKPFRFPLKAFETHLHLIGGTGKGKTTAIHTLLHPLLSDPIRRPCVVLPYWTARTRCLIIPIKSMTAILTAGFRNAAYILPAASTRNIKHLCK